MLHSSPQQSSRTGGTLERSNTIRLRSFKGDDWYSISIDQKTCDCPNFGTKAGGCEHLAALGIHRLRPFTPATRPTFSQALSGLVKSIRLRRVEDAIYWLIYLDTFKGSQYRFRTARRLLIGSAEDGHSVAVMENVSANFLKLSKTQSDLIDLVAEAIRICKLPNWWHPDSEALTTYTNRLSVSGLGGTKPGITRSRRCRRKYRKLSIIRTGRWHSAR